MPRSVASSLPGTQVVAELRRLGGLQKHLFTAGNGIGSGEYAKVLVAITDAR